MELDRHIQWEPLVAVAQKIWRAGAEKKSACGPKPWSAEVMLRVLVLKRLYNLSDEQMEYQLRDRLSFLRFARLGLGDSAVHADSAYVGEKIAADLLAKGVHNYIHEKGTTANALTEEQQRANRRKSKTRARVEHPFAFMEKSLGRIYHRCIGLIRNKYQIGLMNLCYNLCRCVQLVTGRASFAS